MGGRGSSERRVRPWGSTELRVRRRRVALVLAALALLGAVLPAGAGARRRAERAVAHGLLLDSPLPPASLDRAVALAEKLRRRYGIDTGNRVADREAAARRAVKEILEPLQPSPADLEAAARSLGLSLDPAACRGFCSNVEELARLELERRALLRFADGGPAPAVDGGAADVAAGALPRYRPDPPRPLRDRLD